MKNNKGFTLIELMLVVLIIGILSGLTLNIINVRGLRQKAQDAQRITDLGKIQAALELYYSDNRGYPVSNVWTSAASALSALTSGGYISVIPPDPEGTTGGDPCADASNGQYYSYRSYTSTGPLASKYVLTARMRIPASIDTSPCTGLTNWNNAAYGFTCSIPSDVYCYGVQNP